MCMLKEYHLIKAGGKGIYAPQNRYHKTKYVNKITFMESDIKLLQDKA